VLLSDTVGFIRALPKGLLNAFRATLEEVTEAALILHVSDVASPHHQELDEAVKKILADLGVDGRPTLHVWNKVDLLSPADKSELQESIAHPAAAVSAADNDGETILQAEPPARTESPVLVSAVTGEGLDELLRRMDEALPSEPTVKMSLRLPLSEGRTLALVHALGHVSRSQVNDSHMLLDAEIPVTMARRLQLQDYAVRGTF
jgi:GTP-binding protein HflX